MPTLAVYTLVQQLESNVTIPIVMSQRTRMHPALIAIGVLVVGQLFGFIGLFVAVPILSLIVIGVEEFWIKPVEESGARQRRREIALPGEMKQELVVSGELGDGDDGADQYEDHDKDLNDDPESGKLHRPGATRSLPYAVRSPRRAPACRLRA